MNSLSHELHEFLRDIHESESTRSRVARADLTISDDETRVMERLVQDKSGLTEAESQDVVQETMVAVAKRMPSFNYDPALGSFKYWLLQLTRWRVADQFRKRGQIANNSVSADDPESDVTFLDKLEDPASEILDKLWETQWEENLLDVAKTRVKRRVEPRLFQIYDLSVRKEWPPAKVAAALEVPIAQVYLAKHRVADFIMEELKRIEKSVI
jgi:RNA polymerase sigma-70 factor (ECF subfamily)